MRMFLKQLNILDFKNIEELKFDFSKRINIIVGNNAVGKTNLLDAIYYLSMTKSFFSSSDVQNIRHGKDFFVLHGKFENEGEALEVSCSVKKTEGKHLYINQKAYNKISEHIGKIPLVMIAPQDLNLITEYADTRRKFLDALISKFDKEYLNALIQYYQILQHRNAIVKQGENAYQQQDLLDVFNTQLATFGQLILHKRKLFFDEIKSRLTDTYHQLQNNSEKLEIKYISTIQKDFFKELQYSLPKDIRLGYTTVGVHRDDFEILLNDYPAKNYASQGQQKTIVFALKWIELMYLFEKTKIQPILLIDDIYDKLDDERMGKIKELLLSGVAGQVFITDNHFQIMSELLKDDDVEFFKIQKN